MREIQLNKMGEIQLNKMGEMKFNKTYENNEVSTKVEFDLINKIRRYKEKIQCYQRD